MSFLISSIFFAYAFLDFSFFFRLSIFPQDGHLNIASRAFSKVIPKIMGKMGVFCGMAYL